ncbi:MAG: hypothetical protein ABSF22_12635 [Bryobacteraceae bacterium]
MVRVPLAFLTCAAFAAAQSHPSWWTYSSPGATALVGIEWQSVRTSPFADPIEGELWGDLGFPDLPCLHKARQFVVSSPEFLALANGIFASSAMRDQAAKKGFKAMTYRGIDMWFSTEKGVLSLARLTDQLVMIGEPKTLQEAVDRSMDDARNYSPLLARAAAFNQKDLWVVSSRLPDDLASRFVPLDIESERFEGFVSVRNGLELDAVLSAGSEQQAIASAGKLRQAIPTFPAIARGLQVTVEDDSVRLALEATREQVIVALRGPEPVPAPVETIKVETPSHVEYVPVEKPDPPKPVVIEKPQVIRILGLDEGPREIVLPPAVKPANN